MALRLFAGTVGLGVLAACAPTPPRTIRSRSATERAGRSPAHGRAGREAHRGPGRRGEAVRGSQASRGCQANGCACGGAGSP